MDTLIRSLQGSSLQGSPQAPGQHIPPTGAEDHASEPARIRQVLEEVLASPPFCHTQQCQNLLRYIVKHTLAQEEHLLRERVIGAEVFGRRPDYETGEDPVVRIRAAEVRKRLAQFYQSVSESASPPEVQIDIPSGSYRASFRWREGARAAQELAPAAVVSPSSLEVVDPPAAMAPLRDAPLPLPRALQPPTTLPWWEIYRRPLSLAAIVALLTATALLYWLPGARQMRTFQQFWQPWTNSSKPVIVSIGSNAVYRLSEEFSDRYAREHGLETDGMEFFVPTGPDTNIKGPDLIAAVNSFVALGDVAAVSAIVQTVTRQNQAFQERFPNDISFAELRNSPTVLVGGFNNPMTIELTKGLPFVLAARNEIDDTQTPGRRWMLHASLDSRDTSDYAIVTRLAQKNGDAPMMSVAGMGQYGTLAAANFICSPASIARLARQLPAGWANHNLQLVLHIHVVDFKAASTDVVALRVW